MRSFEFRVSGFEFAVPSSRLTFRCGEFHMATFRKFEEIECWKKARELTRQVYKITNGPAFSRDFGLKDQIRKASVSVMSNIAEGYDRSGTSEFIQFLSTAKASAAEVRSQLYVASDQGYLSEKDFSEIQLLAKETADMAGGLMKYLRSSGYKGTKFKGRQN